MSSKLRIAIVATLLALSAAGSASASARYGYDVGVFTCGFSLGCW
jgi:hypothetical protein